MKIQRRFRGFTFVETIATLVAIGLLVALMSQLVFQSFRFSDQNQKIQTDVQTLIRLRTELSRICLQVKPPYWENSPSVFRKENQNLVASYFGGTAEDTVKFWVTDGTTIHVKTKDFETSWGPFPLAKIEVWESNSKVVGVSVRISFSRVDRTFRFPWGSRPL